MNGPLNRFDRPVGSDYDPTGDDLTLQEAADRIHALKRRAARECYAPDHPEMNKKNGGRVRALAQALTLLERAGVQPNEDACRLTDAEEMQAVSADGGFTEGRFTRGESQ